MTHLAARIYRRLRSIHHSVPPCALGVLALVLLGTACNSENAEPAQAKDGAGGTTSASTSSAGASTASGGAGGSGGTSGSSGGGLGGSTASGGASSGSGGGASCVGEDCEPETPCQAVVDCREGTEHVCDIATGTCVACLSDADCDDDQMCQGQNCVAAAICTSSDDCASGRVCDEDSGRCVGCLEDDDCSDQALCAGEMCRPLCESDEDCSGGLLCDGSQGLCTECLDSTHCAELEYCDQGQCAPDRCAADAAFCENNSLLTCAEDGSGLLAPVACEATQTCVGDEDPACEDWVCTPEALACSDDNEVARCANDGLSQTVIEDCTSSGKSCFAGECRDMACAPNSLFCEGGDLRKCNSTGEDSAIEDNCTANEYCDSVDLQCKSKICGENQPACNGSVATTCNADGSGYVSGGTDCNDSSLLCNKGECTDLACVPNEYFCQTGDVYQCHPNGLGSDRTDTCFDDEYCDASTGICRQMLCTPGAAVCNGNVVTTCNDEGSAYNPGGQDCGAMQGTCISGQCENCGTIFFEDFSDGSDWTLGPEWEIGPAMPNFYDPEFDNTPTDDNRVAGVNLGGNYDTSTTHGYYSLISPVIPLEPGRYIELTYFRWLNSPGYPWTAEEVTAWDGNQWQIIAGGGTSSTSWQEDKLDISLLANPDFRIRWSFAVLNTGAAARGGWNLDDVTVRIPCPN